MRSNSKLGLFLLILVIIAIALIEATRKEKIDWRKTYNPNDKIPYGTYVLKNELEGLLPNSPSIVSAGESLYTFLEEMEYDSNATVLFVGSKPSLGKTSNESLLNFVENGGSAFIVAQGFDLPVTRALQTGYQEFSEYESQVDFKEDTVSFYLSNDQQGIAAFDRVEKFTVFNKLNKKTTSILGYAKKGDVDVPNFVKVNYGKGQFYLHLEPDLFTNYYLLKKETFPVVYKALQYLDGRQIIWYDGLSEVKELTTPMRFILSDRALSSSWYLLLIALLLYLVFKSKREQRAVPNIKGEPNLSIAFAKTIGSLYYENGSPGNMVLKKIEYFLFEIRKQYHLDTSNLSDKRFMEALSQRTAIPQEEVELFFTQIQHFQNRKDFSTADLKTTYKLIEEFKQKANLI